MTGDQALWLSEAAGRLYNEIGPGDDITFINIGIESGGQHVIYGLVRGNEEIGRYIIPDIHAAYGDAHDIFARHVVRATPEREGP